MTQLHIRKEPAVTK